MVTIVLLFLALSGYLWQFSFGLDLDYVLGTQLAYDMFENHVENWDESQYPLYIYENVIFDCTHNKEHKEGYTEWLNHILSEDEDDIVSIFSKYDSYASLNKEKTRRDYRNLEGVQLELQPRSDYQIRSVLEYDGLRWILLLWISYLCISAYSDRNSLWRKIQFSTRNGRGWVAIYELCRIWFQTVLFVLAANILLVTCSILLGGRAIAWNIPVQSLPFLGQINWRVSLGLFTILYVIIQALLCCVITTVFTFFLWFWNSYLIAMITYVMVIGVEYLLFRQISPQSKWNCLLYFNLWNAIDPTLLLTTYRNVRIPGIELVLGRSLMLVGSGILTLICSAATVMISATKREINQKTILLFEYMYKKMLVMRARCESCLNYPMLCVYQFMVCKGGIVICVVAVLLMLRISQPVTVYFSPEMGYVKEFYKEWEGELGDDIEQWLLEEQELLDGWKREYTEAAERYRNGEISIREYQNAYMAEDIRQYRYHAYDMICEELTELRSYQDEYGRKVWITNTNALEHLFDRKDCRVWYLLVLLAMSLQLMVLYILFGGEEYLMRIFRSTQYGNQYVFYGKSITMMLCNLSTMIAIGYVWVRHIRSVYGEFQYTVPVQSFDLFRNINWNISLGQFLVILAVWSVLMNSLIMGIFSLCVIKMGRGGFVLCAILSIGPLLMKLLRLHVSNYMNAAALLRWDWMSSGSWSVIPLIIVGLLCLAAWLLTRRQWEKRA